MAMTLYTHKDLMKLFGIGKEAVYKILNSGELAGFRIAGKWRVWEPDLVKYIEKSKEAEHEA